jgi:hypothetical protein
VTVLKAIDMEHELPPDASPIELTGDAFQVEAPLSAVEARSVAGHEAMTLRGERAGLRAVVTFEVPEAGLYSVSSFGTPGNGQRYLVDGCRKAVVCPSIGSGWRAVMSQTLAAGRHTLVLSLADGASLERLKLEKKKNAAADYVATVKRLGFDAGPHGPVARTRALDAMRFVREQRRALMASLCGDRLLIDDSFDAATTTVAGSTGSGAASGQQPGTGDPTGPTGPVVLPPVPAPLPPPLPPLPPPLIPPQPPSSPVIPGGGS